MSDLALPPVTSWWVLTDAPAGIKKLWDVIVIANPTIGLGNFAAKSTLDLLVYGPSKQKDTAFSGNIKKQSKAIEDVSRTIHADSVSISNGSVDKLLGGTSGVVVKSGVTPHHYIPIKKESPDGEKPLLDVVVAGLSTVAATSLGNPIAAANMIAIALKTAFVNAAIPGDAGQTLGFLSPQALIKDTSTRLIKPYENLVLEGDKADNKQTIINSTALKAILDKANGMGMDIALPQLGSYYVVSFGNIIKQLSTKIVEPTEEKVSAGIKASESVLQKYWRSNSPSMSFVDFLKVNRSVLQTVTFTRTDTGELNPSVPLSLTK